MRNISLLFLCLCLCGATYASDVNNIVLQESPYKLGSAIKTYSIDYDASARIGIVIKGTAWEKLTIHNKSKSQYKLATYIGALGNGATEELVFKVTAKNEFIPISYTLKENTWTENKLRIWLYKPKTKQVEYNANINGKISNETLPWSRDSYDILSARVLVVDAIRSNPKLKTVAYKLLQSSGVSDRKITIESVKLPKQNNLPVKQLLLDKDDNKSLFLILANDWNYLPVGIHYKKGSTVVDLHTKKAILENKILRNEDI